MTNSFQQSDSMSELRGKTVAITGASGYLGSAIAASLLASSIQTLVVSRKELASRRGMTVLRADINNYECWETIVRQAQVIFHLAGSTSIYKAAKFPAESLSSTLLPIEHMVKAAQHLGHRPRVVFASTVTLYGLTQKLPVAENTEPNPITVYDLHKLFAEQQLAMATRQGLLESVVLRLANVYGPSPSASMAEDRGILNKIAIMAMRRNDLALYGDGNYLRDYVFIDDVVDAFLRAGSMSELGGRVFNVASGTGTTLRQAFDLVVDQAAQATGQRVAVMSRPWPEDASPIERRNFVASVEMLKHDSGWRPKVDLKQGVGLLVAAQQKIHDASAAWP
jgi:nucleoside-diphosphate-sugar epimerase